MRAASQSHTKTVLLHVRYMPIFEHSVGAEKELRCFFFVSTI
jgi:hypothetical protein